MCRKIEAIAASTLNTLAIESISLTYNSLSVTRAKRLKENSNKLTD